jgi:drug/metabolite transporter (DMT)-like permease
VTTVAARLDDARARRRRGQAAIIVSAIALSSAGVLQRELTLDVTTQIAGRAVFAGVALLLYVAIAEPGSVVSAFRSIGRAGIGVAASMAVASGCFIIALNHTTVARVLVLQAASPMLAALLARVALGERVSPRTWGAMLIALIGVLVMVGGPGSGDMIGTGVSIIMAIGFAVAIVITRHRADVSMAPAVCLAQWMLVAVAGPFAHPSQIGGDDVVVLAGIGAGQMGIGMAMFTVGARLIPAAEVALLNLLEVVLGPVWVWLALSEQPDAATLIGGAIVLVAVVVQILGEAGRPATPDEGGPGPPLGT